MPLMYAFKVSARISAPNADRRLCRLLSVSFADLFPTAQALLSGALSDKQAVLCSVGFLILGLLTASGIDVFVPHEAYDPENGEMPHKNLFRVGIVSTAAIALHNFPEGIAIAVPIYYG